MIFFHGCLPRNSLVSRVLQLPQWAMGSHLKLFFRKLWVSLMILKEPYGIDSKAPL